MDPTERANIGPILDYYVAGETDAVAEDDMVTNAHIVGDVGVSHKQIVAAHRSYQAAALSAAMDGHEFADLVAVADAGFGALATVFLVLRSHTCCAVWKEEIGGADPGRAFEVNVGHETGFWADFDFGSHDAVRTDIGA
jgi:hypothetical protein